MLLALVLFAQVLTAPHAYTTGEPLQLVTQTGAYAVELGSGCENITADINVEVLAGSAGVAAIVPLGSDVLCNLYIGERQSDTPCAMTDGECDVAGQE